MIRRIAPGWGFAPAVDCTPFIATVSDVVLSFFVQLFSKMPWAAWLTHLSLLMLYVAARLLARYAD